MKLRDKFDLSRFPKNHTVANAVEVSLWDEFEASFDAQERLRKFLGRLTELLHKRGVLSDEEILTLVQHFERAEND